MKNISLLCLAAAMIWAFGCKSQVQTKDASASNTQTTTTPNTALGSSQKVPYECSLNDFDYQDAALTQGELFPYVYQGTGRSHVLEAYKLRFQLTYQTPLVGMTNDQVPWINVDNYSELNGNFITYVRNGRTLSLENPYIQVQYIGKKVPSFSSIDSAYIWVDDLFMNRLEGEALTERYELETQSGAKAICKDYKYPDRNGRKGKHLAYAYIDMGDEYLLGIVLTTVIGSDFLPNKPLFQDLVKSYCE